MSALRTSLPSAYGVTPASRRALSSRRLVQDAPRPSAVAMSLTLFHREIAREECVDVRVQGDGAQHGLAAAVAGVELHVEEQRRLAGLCCLQRRRELE